MNIAFLIESWNEIDPQKDSTFRIIHEAYYRKHHVSILHPRNLTVRDNVTYGLFNVLSRDIKVTDNVMSLYKKMKFKKERLPLKGFDVIFLRHNPPLDNLILNFLDSVKDDTFIINDIDGLRKAKSKLYLTTFEDSHEMIPETYVSKDKEFLLSVIDNFKGEKLILKPLEGSGGKGVILLEKRARQNISSLLDFYIGEENSGRNYVILQEHVEGAEQGDVRVLMLNGEPIGAMKRTPAQNDFRANVHAGGFASKYSLSKWEKEICRRIGPKLVSDGMYFVGVDLICGKLIEVNVVSPGGIVNINRLNRVKLQRNILNFVENRYKRTEEAAKRKLLYKKAVEDA